MAVNQYRPKSLPDYLHAVDEIRAQGAGPLWYRGCSSRKHLLLPSLYRERANPLIEPSSVAALEGQLVSRFRDRSLPYRTRELNDNLEKLFFMQHYGVPTRLLDWTENPLSGLFFALRHAEYRRLESGEVSFVRNAAIWVLDPTAWNRHALRQQSYVGGPLDPDQPQVAPYKEIGAVEKLPDRPIAIYGAYNSQRIVVQQGTFVVFGASKRPMDSVYSRDNFPQNALVRLVITPKAIRSIRETLFSHGVTEGAMFPDLEGLGRDLRRTFGFDV